MVSAAVTAAKLPQSCPALCDPIDGSPSGSPVPGILQARTLEWVAISFSNAWTWKVKVKSLSHVRPSVTPWTAAYQVPPSMGFSRQEDWSGVPLPSPRELRVEAGCPPRHQSSSEPLQPPQQRTLRWLKMRSTGYWPQRTGMHIKGLISMSPDFASSHTQGNSKFLNLRYLVFLI